MTYHTDYEVIANLLLRIKYLLTLHLIKYRTATVIRYDLMYPAGYSKPIVKNDDIVEFLRKMRDYFRRSNVDVSTVWSREQDSSPHPHYHCAFIMNSQFIGEFELLDKMEQFWSSVLQCGVNGCVHLGRDAYNDHSRTLIIPTEDILRKGLFKIYVDDTVMWLKYLAKNSYKNNLPRDANGYGTSIMPIEDVEILKAHTPYIDYITLN